MLYVAIRMVEGVPIFAVNIAVRSVILYTVFNIKSTFQSWSLFVVGNYALTSLTGNIDYSALNSPIDW